MIFKSTFTATVVLVLLGACSVPNTVQDTVSSGATQPAFLALGAQSISSVELIEGDSVSIEFPGGTVTYRPSGEKIWEASDGSVVERAWSRRADGVVCEESVGSGEIACSDQGRLLRLGDDIRLFSEQGDLQFNISKVGSGMYLAESP